MNYELIKANKNDISKLIEYKLDSILPFAMDISNDELDKIKLYVQSSIRQQWNQYKMIQVEDKKIGCLFIENKEDGILLNEIYLEEEYRFQGIGSYIIKEIISKNNVVYLWVYKANIKALSLYKKLGFQIMEEKYENNFGIFFKTKTRYI